MARDVTIRIVGDAKKLKSETDEASRAIDRLSRGAQDSVRKMGPKGFFGDLLGDFGGTNAVLLGAGAAIGGFAVKAVGDFQRLALEAENFSTTSGLAVEDASRWIEVAGDLGVESDAVAKSFQRMNVAASKGTLKDLGIDAADAGTRFQNVLRYLSRIPDETKRSAEAQKILGRSWQELAPLVAEVETLDDRLQSVSEQKVIDPAEVEKARRLRDAMDTLNDAWQDVALTVGEELAPALAEVATRLDQIRGLGDSAPSWLTKPVGLLKDLTEWSFKWSSGLGLVELGLDAVAPKTDEVSGALDHNTRILRENEAATEGAKAVTDSYTGILRHFDDVLYPANRDLGTHRTTLQEVRDAYAEAQRKTDAQAEATERYRDTLVLLEEQQKRVLDNTLSGLDAELAMQDARDRLAQATQRGGETFAQMQTGEATSADFAAAFRDEQRAILQSVDAAGRLAEFWGADSKGIRDAQITELQRIMQTTPAQADFISRTIGLLSTALRPTFPTAGGTNIYTAADPTAVATATATNTRRNPADRQR